ncbi:hypothetical protein FRB98_001373 [Tulasnella sp. 332]|nr:hypothetical protein FRB98_001373 [Tulasnella sp. 332]
MLTRTFVSPLSVSPLTRSSFANPSTSYTNSNSPFDAACGGVIGTQFVGNGATFLFNGTSLTATLMAAQDSSQKVQLMIDGIVVQQTSTQDLTLPAADFSTCSPVTLQSELLSDSTTHNATITNLDTTGGWMFFHSFSFTPLPIIISVTSTVTTIVPSGASAIDFSTSLPSTTPSNTNPPSIVTSSSTKSSASATSTTAVATAASKPSTGPIIGGVIAALIIILLVGLWFWRHRRQQRLNDTTEYGGTVDRRTSPGDHIFKEGLPATIARPASFGRRRSTDARYIDLEAIPKLAATRMHPISRELQQQPPIPSVPIWDAAVVEQPSRRPSAPASLVNHTNPHPSPGLSGINQDRLDLVERLVNRNVPREDIAAIIRTMAAAELGGSKPSPDQRRSQAALRRHDIHIPELEMMIRQGREQLQEAPPMYDFKDNRLV